jgi:3-deoxy-manno-octulosonate cytidylyltransferase (CMP-KDO synthetase)
VYNYLGADKCLWTTEAENGTERCMQVIDEVLQYDRYINVQGDMPDITADIIRAVEKELQKSDVATAYTPMDFNLRNDPNSVKMIHSRGRAHWFLRASLTYGDHHLGVYGYNREAKAMYNASTKFVEEDIEKLEQLRWIQNGVKIGVVEVEFDGIEINTPEDLEKWQTKN